MFEISTDNSDNENQIPLIKAIYSVTNRVYTPDMSFDSNSIKRELDLLCYIADGSAYYDIGDTSHLLSSGDVIYISRNTIYSRRVLSEHYHTIYVDFSFDIGFDEILPCKVYHGISDMDLLFKKLSKAWFRHEPSSMLHSMSILYEIYAQMRHFDTYKYVPSKRRNLIADLIHIISQNYTQKELSVKKMAESFNISEVHFRRIFKNVYGISPQQYIINLRITRAKELLCYSDMSISDISTSLGFSDSCYFSKIFKKKTGFNPTEYREFNYIHDNNDIR